MIILQLENLMHIKYLQYKIALNIKFKRPQYWVIYNMLAS